MKRLIPFLSIGYCVYALTVLWFIARLLLRVREVYTSGLDVQESPGSLVPVISITVIAVLLIVVFLAVAYLLIRRRHRRLALIFAGISCLGIPLGTVLGALTVYALTRPEVRSEFTPTV